MFKDKILCLTVTLTTITSVISFLYYYGRNLIATYPDGMSHLMIARRTISSLTPGPEQLGNVWLPLQHILMLPLVTSDFLYQSGIAGSIISMLSYILTTVYLYKTVFQLTSQKGAAFIGALAFASNPNIIYFQSIPMAEMLLLATIAGGTYFLVKWNQTQKEATHRKQVNYLLSASLAIGMACITRYEGWVIMLVFMACMFYSGLRFRFGFWKTLGMPYILCIFPAFLIAIWIAWNAVFFYDPLGFTRGEYAKPSNWVSGLEPYIGNMEVAFETYKLATIHNLSLPVALLGLLGLVYLIARTRFNPTCAVVMAGLSIFPFFVSMLYLGHRPMYVEEIMGGLYNERFALMMIPPAAILIGYMAHVSLVRPILASGVALGVLTLTPGNVVTFNESIVFLMARETVGQLQVGSWFANSYETRGGRILMESYGNEIALFRLGPAIDKVVWEGSYKIWEYAIEYPKEYQIEWILARKAPTPDKVWKSLREDPDRAWRLDEFQLVCQTPQIEIYKRKGGYAPICPWMPTTVGGAQVTTTPIQLTSPNTPITSSPSAESGQTSIMPQGSLGENLASLPTHHVVETGETLSLISARYYGTSARWQEIYEANPDVITNPSLIHRGNRLLIP